MYKGDEHYTFPHFHIRDSYSSHGHKLWPSMLYEAAYNIPFNWKNYLPEPIFKYHSLVWKETNVPVDLHMGVVLPFVSACLGPHTKGHFLT